jgi:hypothetical protein
VVGREVNAAPLNRSPSTATFPTPTVKSADPRLPFIAAKPGRSLKIVVVLLFAASWTLEVPIVAPVASRRTMLTVVATELGFTIATDVTKPVSSQIRVLVVENAHDNGTTAS